MAVLQTLVAPGPGSKLLAITKSDSTVYDPPLRALWVGGTGNVAILAVGVSDPQILLAVPSGYLIEFVMIKSVMETDTSATNMVGCQ